jgi:hypothetical protein
MDRTYIRPFLIHKYEVIKDRVELEFEDVLQEYKLIQEELDYTMRESANFPMAHQLSKEVKDHFEQSRNGERVGLLQQYIEAKMAKQISGVFLNSVIDGGAMTKNRISAEFVNREQTTVAGLRVPNSLARHSSEFAAVVVETQPKDEGY